VSRPFEIHEPERAFRRRGLFAVELLDPVTLERVTAGVRVVAEGLEGAPLVNSSGLFVWLDEDVTQLRNLSIDPRTLPYDGLELQPAELNLPPSSTPAVTTIELPPRVDYPFSAGATAMRGTLVEEIVAPPQAPTPVANARIHLRWLDDDGTTWHDAPTISRTNAHGNFAAVLRIAPADLPQIDSNGALTVRLRASREGSGERGSADFKLLQGRVADPTTLNAFTFAWDDLQP
jgi:hypothetical protein